MSPHAAKNPNQRAVKQRNATIPSAADVLPSTALQSIGAHLASVLRERIVTGVYAPGEWIRESLLAQEFGYSNGPIREALQLLVGAAKKRGDIDELMALGRQLSQWVCDGSGNQRLASDWTRLTSQTRIYIYASLRAMAGQRGVSADEPWRELITAIASRDTDAARLAARHLMQRTLKALGLDAGM